MNGVSEGTTAGGPASGRPAPLLQSSNVCVRYGGVVAVDDLSINVGSGELVGLIGPNGAGKTSFIDAISGFVVPHSGSVVLGGESLDGRKAHQRARAGLVRTFQQLELFVDLTVRENIAVAARSTRRSSSAHFEMAVHLLGLKDVLDRPAADLSQGRRRLVALARAIASGPSVLLLDEPAAGLDTDESVELGEQLRKLAAEGVGILLVDHDMGLVLSACDWITVIDFGRLLAAGTPAQVRVDKAVLDAYLGVS